MSATAGQADGVRSPAERLGIESGMVVMEIGYDDDCDEQLRGAITRIDGVELVDEDYDDVVDVVLLWWRDGDGDLVDALVDALTPLADGGYIWLLTPKAGRSGHVQEHVFDALGQRRDMDVYICGLAAMVDDVRPRLKEFGLERRQIIFEKYD